MKIRSDQIVGKCLCKHSATQQARVTLAGCLAPLIRSIDWAILDEFHPKIGKFFSIANAVGEGNVQNLEKVEKKLCKLGKGRYSYRYVSAGNGMKKFVYSPFFPGIL